jgi:CrcB protein
MDLLLRLLLLCLAGSAGTLARYGVYEGCGRLLARTGWQLPAATLIVNIVGSFLFGLVWAMWDQQRMSMQTRVVLLGGFMGAFTTFSSFAFDTGDLIARGQYVGAAANVLANNVLGIGAFFVGLWVATLLPRSA